MTPGAHLRKLPGYRNVSGVRLQHVVPVPSAPRGWHVHYVASNLHSKSNPHLFTNRGIPCPTSVTVLTAAARDARNGLRGASDGLGLPTFGSYVATCSRHTSPKHNYVPAIQR
jgi:hypothetical protein